MSNMTIYEKLNFINNNTNLIKQILVDSGLLTADEATLENLPPVIQEFIRSQQENPYQELYMQRTANETVMKGLFAYTPKTTTLDLSNVNTSKVTDMSYMFSECKVPYLDLSGFDVSNVTNMERMFNFCSSEINIDGWDTSNLTNANYMFSSFTNNNKYIDLSVFDFSNVTYATYMFNACDLNNIDIRNINIDLTRLNFSGSSAPGLFYQATGTLDLSNWILDSSITKLERLCYWFNGTEINLTNWRTTNITTMSQMFYYNSNLVRLIIPDWDMTNTTVTTNFVYNCSKLNYIDLSRSNDTTIAMIATLIPAQKLATYGQILIPADSSQANIEALATKYWKPVGPRIDMTSTELALEFDEIKPGKTTKLYYGNSEPWYGNDASVEYVSSDESIATIDKETMMVVSTGVEGTTEILARIADTQEVISEPKLLSVSETDNYPNVIKFRGTSTPSNTYNYILINGTSSNNNRVLLSAMDYNSASGIYTYDAGVPITRIQFNGYGNQSNALNTCTEVVKINTSNVTDMSDMFRYCTNLTTLDVSNFDTSNVTNMEDMFYECNNLTSLDVSNFDTSKVTNMRNMFYECNNLTSLDVSNFDTGKVTDMGYMFNECNNLTSLDVSNFDTGKVTDMSGMFWNCGNLTELNLSNFDMTNVNGRNYMFRDCNKLHTLRLDNCSNDTINKIITSSNFPTNKIEGVTRKIYCKEENIAGLIAPPTSWIFVDCESGEEIIPLPKPYVPGEFKNNSNITEVNVLVTAEHTNLSEMFKGCANLTTINGISEWNTSNVTTMNEMFADCTSLTELDLSSFDTSSATNMAYMFADCSELQYLNLSNFDMSRVTSMYNMIANRIKLHTIRLDNCSNDTINKIINSSNFPTNAIEGVTRKIYVKEANAAGLTPPTNWIFEFVD